MDFDLSEMLELRKSGWSTLALGRRYGKDHTTILHHCKKRGIEPPQYKFHTLRKSAVCVPKIQKTPLTEEERKALRVKVAHDQALKQFVKSSSETGLTEGQIALEKVWIESGGAAFVSKRTREKTYAEYLREAQKRPTERYYDERVGFEIHQSAFF